MTEQATCLDSSVFIKALTGEAPASLARAADRVLRDAFAGRVVAPAFAWAEVGSVLRKMVRQGRLPAPRAEIAWREFCLLPTEFIDDSVIRARAWALAREFNLSTLYDASFLACAEVSSERSQGDVLLITADSSLVSRLMATRCRYVRDLRLYLGQDA